MPGPTTVRTELKGSIGIISLTGDITVELEKSFSDAYKEVTKSGAAKILLRFSGECFMNSAGDCADHIIGRQGRRGKPKGWRCGALAAL